MGAGKFAAATAAREKADPEGYRLAIARNEHDRRVKQLEAEHAATIAELRRELAAAQTALRQTQTDANRVARQFETSAAALRQELETVQAALSNSQTENERMRRRLKQCEPLLALIAAATPDGSNQS